LPAFALGDAEPGVSRPPTWSDFSVSVTAERSLPRWLYWTLPQEANAEWRDFTSRPDRHPTDKHCGSTTIRYPRRPTTWGTNMHLAAGALAISEKTIKGLATLYMFPDIHPHAPTRTHAHARTSTHQQPHTPFTRTHPKHTHTPTPPENSPGVNEPVEQDRRRHLRWRGWCGCWRRGQRWWPVRVCRWRAGAGAGAGACRCMRVSAELPHPPCGRMQSKGATAPFLPRS
jgi:hypothetical protein